ncbi:hypothetical protein [Ureibacillus chungkukjangi]|uniref:Uncharacterized protein n=1 Tax=Ureibacillus chungkukjangi TaxID=1202712 RepID=A0A318TK65_9BACL|nr:hypothetical protein [Ureibacillus chungkukjangi]PYF05202.1 hypothetical protein BJ095_11820 [Ureibacillus chungkukjangi]
MDKNNSFNDAVDYLKKHIGIPDKISLKKLPVFLRIFGYLVALILFMSLLLFFILPFLN